MITSRPIVLFDDTDQIELTYRGYMAHPVGMENIIGEKRIELSMHSCFHPFIAGGSDHTHYDVTVTLPRAYQLWTNGAPLHHTVRGRQTLYTFTVITAQVGIFLFAVQAQRILRHASSRFTVEAIYVHTEAESRAADALLNIVSILDYYERKFGPLNANKTLSYIISPRASGGYVFGQNIVVPEYGPLRFAKDDYRYLGLTAHEAAHLYWDFAPFSQNEDWITEGLAEYSAVSYLVERLDAPMVRRMLDAQLTDILSCQTGDPIIATAPDSEDFGQNRGTKPAWLYFLVGKKSHTLDNLFTSLYQEFSGKKLLSSEQFLDALTTHLEREDADYLMTFLQKPGWSEDDVLMMYQGILRTHTLSDFGSHSRIKKAGK